MPKKILIVEDDPDMVEILRLALTGEDYVIHTALTGTEALEKAQMSPPDLVLLDLILPELNGFDVCERLRRNPTTAFVPIIMVTALPGELPRLAGVEAGADAYIRKPFEIQDLVARVSELLHHPRALPLVHQETLRMSA
jgi:DNA-binding response OmpR family regulator